LMDARSKHRAWIDDHHNTILQRLTSATDASPAIGRGTASQMPVS
jgi:hypothetical protein